MSSSLYGRWGADKPVVQVNMELDPLMPPGRLGKFPRGGGPAELVHLTIDHEPQVFLYRPCNGDVHICVLYIDGHSPFALFDGQPEWCLGFHHELRNDQMVIQVGEIYDRTHIPCLLWHQERDGWRNPWFLNGWWEVIPTPTWLLPSVCDARHLLSRLCHCGAKVSPHPLHLDENIESAIVPYLAAHLVNFSDAFRHPAGMVKVAGMVKDPKDPSRWGGLMGVIQVMTPLSVCSSLSCWTLQ